MIAWTKRIEREGPWLLELLDSAPDRSVLDVGPGTGEHTAFFADQGARAVGVDSSETMIEAARDYEAAGRGRFVLGDARDADRLLASEAPFGMAICLGNMLPHLLEDADLDQLFGAVGRLLLPGGRYLIQLLNYERILSKGVRHLPVNFREGDDGEEIVFLRLMTPAPDGRIIFCPTTFTLDLTSDEPVSVRGTKRVELRAWTSKDVTPALERAGFEVELHGDMHGGPYDAEASNDLVVVASKSA